MSTTPKLWNKLLQAKKFQKEKFLRLEHFGGVFRLLLDVVENVAEVASIVEEVFRQWLSVLNLLKLPTIFEMIELVHELCPFRA